MITYRIVINMIQTFQEVIEVDASNVQRARALARAEIDSLEFKDLVDTDYRIDSITRAEPAATPKGMLK